MRSRWFLIGFAVLTTGRLLAATQEQPQPSPPSPADVALVHTAAGDSSDAAASKAFAELKSLGFAAHVAPILADRRTERAVFESQRDAVRLLLRANDREAIDAMGRLLERRNYFPPGDERAELQDALFRETVDAIYRLAGRPSPIDGLAKSASSQSLIPPALRMASILKPPEARRTPLPADDPRGGGHAYLRVEKTEWLLGESVLLHYELKNEGERPFTVKFGGDNRTSPGRSLRFKVLAFDEAGELVDDPYPSRMCFGGPGGEKAVEPGGSFWEPIPLWRFCAFTRPGTYTVRVYHDAGWEGPHYFGTRELTNPPLVPHIAPIAEIKITFLAPTPAQARKVVQTILISPDNPQHVMGQRSAGFREITSVIAPEYIPVLRETLDKGSTNAIEALGIMPAPEATTALVDLTSHGDAGVRERAIQLLLLRLPNGPDFDFSNRFWLAPRSWRDEFTPAVTALGWQLLDRPDSASILQGAQILEALGQKDDLPRLIGVFDRVIERFRSDRKEQNTYPREADTSGRVFAAVCKVFDRGATPPIKGSSAGNGLVMLRAIKQDEKFRPAGWEEDVQGLLAHKIPYVCAAALENLPRPVPEELQHTIVQRLLDPVPPVQVAACGVARELKLKKAVPVFLKMMAESDDFWRVSTGYYAAAELGVTPDRLTEICVGRLKPNSDPASTISNENFQIFLLVTSILDKGGGASGSQIDWSVSPQLIVEWHKLVDAERERIAKGEKLKLGEGRVTTDLFPRGFSVSLPDNKGEWPKWEQVPAGQRRGGQGR